MTRSPAPQDEVLSAPELAQLSAFIYQRTGMIFGERKRYYIERRVADRMASLGLTTVAAYLQRLVFDAAETQTLVNSFTVNETYFYREAHQLACLSSDLLPDIAARRRPGDKIRIWSNPCSTGEEAYSIALWLLENWRLVDAYHVEIIGSDIDTRALAAAKAGLYGERALSKLPQSVREAYFEPAGKDRFALIADLRESVTFTPVNIVDGASMAALGRFDVIFCRNLLIYFDEASRQAAARHLYEALLPGGFLCLGHSESMARISDRFEARRFPEAMVYQRPVGTDG